MLHLSFTQQLCHIAKIKHGEAANDAIFGLKHAPTENAKPNIQDDTSAPYTVFRQIAERYLKDEP